uniref:Reverse transcriptase domain-containing protein n=1 Tax=Nicotiana tabacum TaxID=4097 RepID=A0A1S4CUH9_TOBAC|nr:PREDICTED: uncharacterized protein LOC107822723 [Nicotiana tabacum]
MEDKFATAHVGEKKAEARVNDIFAIKKTSKDGTAKCVRRNGSRSLPKWVKHERIKGNQKIAQQTHEVTPTTWEEIHNAYCAEVRADEDDLNGLTQRLTLVQTEARRDRRNDGRRDQPPRLNRERHQPYVRTTNPPPPRDSIRTGETRHEGTMATKMRSDPSARRSNVLCEFHQERGHKIEDCIGLRQEVVRMLNQGYLKEMISDKGRANFARGRDPSQGLPKPPSPAHTIQMIIGGGDHSVINHVKLTTTHKLKRTVAHEWYDDFEDCIIFKKSDDEGLSFPHYDALVITLCIVDTDVKRIMVEDGSDVCIIHLRVLVQMRLKDRIIPRCITLTGFNNAVEWASGKIALLVLAGGSHAGNHIPRHEPGNSL